MDFWGGFFEIFLEWSVDLIIYRDYIVNRRFFIYLNATVGKDACGNFQGICGLVGGSALSVGPSR